VCVTKYLFQCWSAVEMYSPFAILVLLLGVLPCVSNPAFEIGGPSGAGLCQLFAGKNVYKGKCHPPSCHWNTWHEVNTTSNKIVLSLSHNGFGNQLWEHSFGFAVAGALGARFLVGKIPPPLFVGGYMPQNTEAAFELVNHLLPNEFEYDSLPPNSHERELCEKEDFFIGDRPVDLRKGSISKESLDKLTLMMNDPKPRCLRLLGYFQQAVFCDEDVRELWGLKNVPKQMSLINITNFGVSEEATPAEVKKDTVVDEVVVDKTKTVAKALNQTELLALLGDKNIQMSLHDLIAMQDFPGPNDLCIYLRCLPSHYEFNNVVYYDTLLKRIKYDKIFVFEAPPCVVPRGKVVPVLNYLYKEKNATKFVRHIPSINVTVPATAITAASIHTIHPKLAEALDMFLDLYGLTLGKKVCW
jgi:hypothetical protein